MDLQFLITTNAIGLAMMLVLMISSHLVRHRNTPSDKCFTFMIILVSFACVVEALSYVVDKHGDPVSVTLGYLTNTLLYASNVTGAAAWCIYVDLRLYNDVGHTVKYARYECIPAAAAVLLLIPNLFLGYIFSIDEKGCYSRHAAGYSYYLVMLGYIILSFVKLRIYYHNNGKVKFFPMYMFVTPVLCGSLAQALVYGLSLAWCSAALGMTGIYMSLQNELSYLDPLTKLYNRNFLDHKLSETIRKKNHIGGIMIDIDYFKTINDQFGHSTGDEALIDAAAIIRRAVPVKAVTIRFAGDEFIVIMRTAKESDMTAVTESIRQELRRFNEAHTKKYTLSFSIGHSMLDPEKSSADRFFNDMDSSMYEEKRKKHSRSSARKIEVVIRKPENTTKNGSGVL